MRSPGGLAFLALATLALLPGCGGVEATYGHVAGQSVNGTGLLAQALRNQGAEVRSTRRLNEEVGNWADTLVRFAPFPGAPGEEEADWYRSWLASRTDRRLIYVFRDFSAAREYWDSLIAGLPADAPAWKRQELERKRDRTVEGNIFELIGPKERDDADDWFGTTAGPSVTCQKLAGPWAVGVDTKAAAIHRGQSLKEGTGTILLSGDGKALVVERTLFNDNVALIVANGSFLLNEPVIRHARRPLAEWVLWWVGTDGKKIAFIEGISPVGEPKTPTLFDLLWIDPIGWIGGHIIALGLLGGFALAVRLGRPRGEPPTGFDRPVAHAEALGSLLARTGDFEAARTQVEAYRRWRQQSSPSRPRKTGGLV